MTPKSNAIIREASRTFPCGRFSLQVSAYRTDGGIIGAKDLDADHIIDGLLRAVKSASSMLDALSGANTVSSTSSSAQSKTVNGVTLDLEVTLTTTDDVPAALMVLVLDQILDDVKPCVIHTLNDDPDATLAAITRALGAVFTSIIGDMPMYFPYGDAARL